MQIEAQPMIGSQTTQNKNAKDSFKKTSLFDAEALQGIAQLMQCMDMQTLAKTLQTESGRKVAKNMLNKFGLEIDPDDLFDTMEPYIDAQLTTSYQVESDDEDASYAESQFKKQQLFTHIKAMKQELDELRSVNNNLARALGACAACWGEDEECEICEGYGSPGEFKPNQRLYTNWVTPAVERVNAMQEARQQRLAQTGRETPSL